MGVRERILAGGASLPSRSLPPRTQRRHARTGARAAAFLGVAVLTQTHTLTDRPGLMDEGTRELRTSRPYLHARSCGRAGRGAGGKLPGSRPGSRGSAAHDLRRVWTPSGQEPALAATPPSLVHNLEARALLAGAARPLLGSPRS